MSGLRHHHLGNVAEYLLPAGLIGLVAIGATTWAFSGQFAQNGGLALYQGKAIVATGQGKMAIQTKEMGTNPTLGSFSYLTDKGNRISFPNFPGDILQSIEVNGGQGTMDQLSAALRAMAEQLLASGEIDQAQANAIIELSNRGFDIGKDLGAFEIAMQGCQYQAACVDKLFVGRAVNNDPNSLERIHGRLSANNTRELDATSREFYSQQILTPDANKGLVDLLGPSAKEFNGSFCTVANCAETFGTTLLSFYEAYGRTNSLSLSVENRAVLNHLTASIALVAQRQSGVFRDLAKQGQGTIDNSRIALGLKDSLELGNINLTPPSFLVNDKSAKICDVGQGTVTQGQCK